MFIPPGAIQLVPSSTIFLSAYSLPCLDKEQNPAIGRRCVTIAYRVPVPFSPNGECVYLPFDLSQYLSAVLIDKVLCVEVCDIAELFPKANNILGVPGCFLACDISNQFVDMGGPSHGVAPGQSCSIVRDVFMPNGKCALIFAPFGPGGFDIVLSVSFYNFKRRIVAGHGV